MPDGTLADVRVLDLTHLITGPFATRYLADFGADVIKVEPPWGEPGRTLAPFQGDDPHPEKSGTFFFLNRNKRGITLNLKTASGKAIFWQLVETADIVIENFRPGVMASLALAYDDLAARKPSIVMVSISNFGQIGPYRDFKGSETVLYGMGGEMYSIGTEDRWPLKMGGTAALIQAGGAAAAGAIGALFGARMHGIGQHVDLSIVEALASSPDRRTPAILAYQWTGAVTRRRSDVAEGFVVGVYPCVDGFIEIFTTPTQWDRLKEMLGNPPDLDDPAWDEPHAYTNPELKAQFDVIFYTWLLERTKLEVWHAAGEAHVLCAPLYTTADLLADPHFRERGYWREIEHAVMGRVTMPGLQMTLSESPIELKRPAPLLGEHNIEVYGELGYTREDLALLKQEGAI